MGSIRPEDWASPAIAPGLADRNFGTWYKVPLGTGTAGGGLFSWAAPYDCFVDRVIVDVTTVSTGAANVDAGSTAVSATTLSDNLIDGADIHTATGAFDNYVNHGTNGLAMVRVARGKWVTGSTEAAADPTGLVGNAYIHAIEV